MNWHAAYGLLADALIFGALGALIPVELLRQRAALTLTATALLVGIAPSLHGFFGMPSFTLLQLAIWQHAGRPSPFTPRAAAIVLLGAGLLYPMSAGWTTFDLYALGYQPLGMLAALAGLGILLFRRGKSLWLLLLTVDLLGYASGLFGNLWDALIDPLLVLLAILVICRAMLRRSKAISAAAPR